MTERHFIHELPNGKFREATTEEIALAVATEQQRLTLLEEKARIEKELNAIAKGCKHPVCYDTSGYIYNERHCVVCGHLSLI